MDYIETHPWITFKLDLISAPTRFWTLLGDACARCEVISGIPLMPETAATLNLVSFERGALATTAIEGNTLSQEEVARLGRGELHLPPSKAYLGKEVNNILHVFNQMIDLDPIPPLSLERVKYLNGAILDGLDLDDEVVPGEIRAHEVGVARYRGAPAKDCEYLLNRLCEWLNGMDTQLGHSQLALPIVKAIVAHLYLLWIHPFGDGNGRVARLAEYQILLSAGVPNPVTHLLSKPLQRDPDGLLPQAGRRQQRTKRSDRFSGVCSPRIRGWPDRADRNNQSPDTGRHVDKLCPHEIP